MKRKIVENITVKPPEISTETRDKLVREVLWNGLLDYQAEGNFLFISCRNVRKSKISLNLIFAVSFLTRRNPEAKPAARSGCSLGPELKSSA